MASLLILFACVGTALSGRGSMPLFEQKNANLEDSMVDQMAAANSSSNKAHDSGSINNLLCGIMPEGVDKAERIIGGEVTKISQYPWTVVLMLLEEDSKPEPVCGGSLISKRHVLTAAHCVLWVYQVKYLYVLFGAHDLTDYGSWRVVGLMSQSNTILHENYNYTTRENDIGIIRLKTPVQVKWNIQTICLQTDPKQDFVGKTAVVSGWGVTEYDKEYSDVLRAVNVTVISNEACSKLYGPGLITDDMLCAGHENGGKDSCQRDSGGPLFTKVDDIWTQIGIVSWGKGCARAEYPGIYVKVAYFMDWIKAHTEY